MSNTTVKFITKEYSIPEDLLVYLDLLDLTNDVRMALNKKFYQLLRNEEVGCIGDDKIRPEIDKQIGRFIAKLMEVGVYDRTVTDYLSGNKGFELIANVNNAAFLKMKELLIQELDEYKAGVEDALYKRDSSITGMGFSIWSGSFVNHAIYAAMEASTLNKQEAAANREYQREIDALHNSITSRHDGAKKTYIDTVYIPNMEAAIAVFSFELLDTYISDLIINGKLDKSVLNYINIDRSNDLLKNLDLSPNKEVILHKAFEACPYNLQVYGQALNCGLMDYATYQTAQYFRQGKNILFSLVGNLGEVEYPNKFRINYGVAAKMAEFTQSDVISVLQAKTKDYVASLIKAYGDAVKTLDNSVQTTKMMSDLPEQTILAGSSASRGKAASYINGIVSKTVWTELTTQCGYTDLLDRIKVQVPGAEPDTTKHDVDSLLEERLYPVLEKARQSREIEILKKRDEEAKTKAAEAEKARRTAERNKKIVKLSIVAAIVIVAIVIASTIINKVSNTKAYQGMAGEFCVYRVINEDGEERDDFNWWLSIGEDGTIKMSSWSYAFDDTEVDSYSGNLKNKANFRKFEDYRIEEFCADVAEYEEALYCYEFHIADAWYEFDGYIICWQYQNGKIIDVYCNDYRYSFVETSDDYSFSEWEKEINSDQLSENVQKLVDNIDLPKGDEYTKAVTLLEAGKYEDALLIFTNLKGYKDSDELALECKYNIAENLMSEGEYAKAYRAFVEIDNYRDSISKAVAALNAELQNCKVGDIIQFGEYEQDGNLENGSELIDWIILDIQNGKALVISKFALDVKSYNTHSADYVTWENSSIRTWLNQTFVASAFHSGEIGMILDAEVPADKNPVYDEIDAGNTTTDKVFLLSIDEAKKYLPTWDERKCEATAYIDKKYDQFSIFMRDGFCDWWLRTPGEEQDKAAYVSSYDDIVFSGDLVFLDQAVRPAMWIEIVE